MDNLKEVGTTTPGIWEQISNGGFLTDYPGAVFQITHPHASFTELSKGTLYVREEDANRFLRLKEQMKEEGGGSWIID